MKHRKGHIGIPGVETRPMAALKSSLLRDMVEPKIWRFATAFSFFCIALYASIWMLPGSVTKIVNEHTAGALGLMLNVLDIPVLASGETVSGCGVVFRIIPECTPLLSIGLFCCFVVFYPAGWREKVLGLLAGVAVFYMGNLARLSALFAISRFDQSLFSVMHVYLGQVFTVFLIILVCLIWMKWLNRGKSGCHPPHKAGGILIRFALISVCLFWVWMMIQDRYIGLIDRIISFGFALLDIRFVMARNIVFYYETFSVVGFASLVLAGPSVPWRMKARIMTAGLGFLFVSHLFHRVDNVLIELFHFPAAFAADLTFLAIGQYLLPMLLLIFLVHGQKENKGAGSIDRRGAVSR